MSDFTKSQYKEEMFGRKANGLHAESFESWKEKKKLIEALFDAHKK